MTLYVLTETPTYMLDGLIKYFYKTLVNAFEEFVFDNIAKTLLHKATRKAILKALFVLFLLFFATVLCEQQPT